MRYDSRERPQTMPTLPDVQKAYGTKVERAAAGAMPFILSMLAVLMLITYVPWLSLAPLSLMGP